MDLWSVFADLPEDGADELWKRASALSTEPFVAFAEDRLAEASNPGLRAAYEALDGPWADDFGFKRLLASLLFRGQVVFERALADPGCIWEIGVQNRSDDLVQTLEELGVEMPAPPEKDPEARYEGIERWREEHFRPLTIEHALAGEIRDELVASLKLEVVCGGSSRRAAVGASSASTSSRGRPFAARRPTTAGPHSFNRSSTPPGRTVR